MGYVAIWHGRQVRPRARASSLYFRIADYIYKEAGNDWSLVARKLEEVAAMLPAKVDASIELGNAYVRLGERDKAIAAYRRLRTQDKIPVEEKVGEQLDAQIARLESGIAMSDIGLLRNPWLE